VIVGGTNGLGKWSALNESLPGRIFISYRRQETAWPARQLYDVLVEHFPAEQVFKDVDNIDPGDEFVERITSAVESCDVLLALIGPNWLTITNKKGQRRLDDPKDYVRLEIETALTRKIRVIPILVDDAQMPGEDELPPTVAPLVYRNAVEINPVTFDTKRLISTVRRTLAALKVSDTTTGSASPTSTPRPDRSNQQVAGPEVERLYDQALAAFWTEQWDKAVDLLGQVLHQQPDNADAARKLELARRQQELAMRYAQASAATDARDWEQAVAGYTMIADADPGYRDTNARLADARRQHQLATLRTEARRLHRAGQWAAVIKVGEQLQAIDPAAAGPDELVASARTELAAEQRAPDVAADYHAGLRAFDAGRWQEAVEALDRVTRLDATYQDAPALVDRARRELEQAAAALAQEQARRHSEEQARREADEQARRAADEQARREAEEQVSAILHGEVYLGGEVGPLATAEAQTPRAAASEPAAKAADPSTTEPPTAPEKQEQTSQSRISDVDLFPPEALPPSTGEPTDSRVAASTPTRTPHFEGPQASQESPPEAPSPPPTAPAPPKRALWKFSGIAALVSSALMLLCIVLPQQYGTSTSDNDPIKATYLLCLGLVVLSLGGLTLTARWRIHGLGGVIGAASVSTVVAFDMVNTLDRIGSSELGLGFWAGFLAPLVLLAAGVLAVAAARRETDAGFAALDVSDWTSWVVLVLAVAGSLILVPAAMKTYASLPGWGLQNLWLAVLAVAVPLTALLTRPVLLGRWLLLGWALACATLVLPIWMSWERDTGSSHGMWFVMLTLAAIACLAPIIHRSRTGVSLT
jgi:TIR domain